MREPSIFHRNFIQFSKINIKISHKYNMIIPPRRPLENFVCTWFAEVIIRSVVLPDPMLFSLRYVQRVAASSLRESKTSDCLFPHQFP